MTLSNQIYKKMKICKKCMIKKENTEFYVSKTLADRLDSSCKECRRAINRARGKVRYHTDIQAGRAYRRHRYWNCGDREYALNRFHNDPAARERQRANKNKSRNSSDEMRLHAKVQKQTYNAICRGELTREPCEKCGESKVHAHHDDYLKPLDVRWLCQRCHAIEHRL